MGRPARIQGLLVDHLQLVCILKLPDLHPSTLYTVPVMNLTQNDLSLLQDCGIIIPMAMLNDRC